MKFKTPIFFGCIMACCLVANAQYWSGQDSLYGQEWINFNQTYVKFNVAEDGVYKLDYQGLLEAGIPVDQLFAKSLQVWHFGEQVPIIATTDSRMSNDDYFLVYARKNRGDFETHLYPEGIHDQLNPEYSMFTDSAAYFVTWNLNEDGLRLTEMENDLTNLPAEEPFFIDEIRQVYNNRYLNYCQDQNCFIVFSHFDNSEGWAFQSGSHVTNFTLYPNFIYRSGPDGRLVTRVTNNMRNVDDTGVLGIYVNDSLYSSTPYNRKPALMADTLTVPIEQVQLGMEMSIAGEHSGQKLAVSTYSLQYPRQFRFERDSSYTLTIPSSNDDKNILLNNFNGGDQIRIWDFENGAFINADLESNFAYRFRLRGADKERKIFVHKVGSTERKVENLQSVNFRDYSEIDPNYIIISHPKFMDDGQGNNFVLDYAQYRASQEGGDFTPVIVPITTLMDQFAYGIEKHPSAIRHFVHWITKNWSDPQFVLLMGKGVVAHENREVDIDWHSIPTFGFPGSDMLLISDQDFRPLLPIGRIPVVEASEIGDYLEKVITHEQRLSDPQTTDDREWAKDVVHLSGGDLGSPVEISLIRDGLDQMADTISKSMMSPTVHTFQKKTSGTVSVSDNERLTGLINNGVSLVTYFGHSGVQLLDFQIIDDVNTLPSNDRFHVFMAMGCYAGDIFDFERRSYSETWALVPNKGSVVFIANSSAGYIPTLKSMGNKIYHNYSNRYYGQAIGTSIKEAVGEFIEENRIGNELNFNVNVELAFSLNICGDPAVKLIQGPTPDLLVDPESVNIKEEIITIESDSLNVAFDVVNLGKFTEDSVALYVEQTLPDGERVTVFEDSILMPRHRDTINIRIPGQGEKAGGFNRLEIAIDAGHKISEEPAPAAEANNSLRLLNKEYVFFVAADDAKPMYPPEFGIMGDRGFHLSASTSEAHLEDRSYVIEIDTSETFNSPFRQSQKVLQKGGLVQWMPNLTWEDERVYYWRISPDSIGRGQYTWRNSSFVFIEGHQPGWNQSHYYQFQKDRSDSLMIEERSRKWLFPDLATSFKVRNVIVDDVNYLRPEVTREGESIWDYYFSNPIDHPTATATTRSGVYVTIVDPKDLNPILNPSGGDYGSINREPIPIEYFAYNTEDYQDRVSLMDLLDNQVPADHYVFFMTIREPGLSYGLDFWSSDRDSLVGRSILDVLSEKGANKLGDLQSRGEVPYVFIYQQGNSSFSQIEELGEMSGIMEANVTFLTPVDDGAGRLTSTMISNVGSWNEFQWQTSETNANDRFWFDIIGENQQGGIDTLIRNIGTTPVDLSSINVQQYPGLQLMWEVRDTTDLSPAQLDFWRVTYDELPELAVDLNTDFYFYNDTLQQGEELVLRFTYQNLSPTEFDSIEVEYLFIDEKNNESRVYRKYGTLPGRESTTVNFNYPSNDLRGDYRLIVTVNPEGKQREFTYQNNTFILGFTIIQDRRNPILDVTFDGIHILDGDLVSARPEINIRLTDENEFLILSDTSLFDVYLKYPNGVTSEKLRFTDPDVTFTPGNDQDNTANILIDKKLETDGIYTLIVQAQDGSGNVSGDVDYQISFEVINETSISEILNYPNPFSTSTKFVYTLTGDQSPDFFKIQIMTLSGKVVREITSAEIGPLKVGKHMTDYVYDGKDEYGEPLANGVYLYRMIARDQNGDEIKSRDVGISDYFKKGWGKMVILR